MKIIIVENELYLAQSIASKLHENGYETEIYSSVKKQSQVRETCTYSQQTSGAKHLTTYHNL